MIVVDPSKLEASNENIDDAINMLNHLCDAVAHGDYREGTRNNIAVDLACLCYVLGLDPYDVAEEAWQGQSNPARRDLKERLDVIDRYLEDWNNYGGVLSYMLLAHEWRKGEASKKTWVVCR